jgi:hypothetical protein
VNTISDGPSLLEGTGRVRLFVSGGPELEPEREAIGRALAEFPINLGWEIKRTPMSGQHVDLRAVREADVLLLLFASDIRAPVGAEWMTSRERRLPSLAFLRQGSLHTPAGREFSRHLRGEWRPYRSTPDLVHQILLALSGYVLDHWQDLGLSGPEWEALSTYRARLQGDVAGDEEVEATPEPAGAGGGGVILAPGRDLPEGGVAVDG